MLKNEKFKIKIRKDFIEYYQSLNYNINDGNFVEVFAKDLHKGSSQNVNVVCDGCGDELNMKYKVYYQNIKKYNDNKYHCKKCKYLRIKKTNLDKYGVENVMHLDSIKNKMINTQSKRFNDINDMNYRNKEKMNNNIIEKYGSLETYYNSINEKKKLTCLKKYNVDNVMKVDKIKEKGQQTCFNKYGEKNPMLIKEFIEKSVKKSLSKKN